MQVSVDDDHSVAPGIIQTGGDSDLVTEVTGKVQHLDSRVGSVQLAHELRRAVAAAIVDEYKFPRIAGLVHHLLDTPVEFV